MNIAIFTMIHNEDQMIDLWCRFYSKFQQATLFIIDHGSDLPLEPYVRGRATILKWPRRGVDEHIERTRAASVSAMQNALIKYFDTVIYTDADEFIVLDPQLNESFEQYLAKHPAPIIAPLGLNVIHDADEEAPLDRSIPILRQRRTAVFVEHFCKPLITREPIEWGSGFHTSKSPMFLDESIFLFHLNMFDRESKYRRQKEREAIAVQAGKNIATWGWGESEIEKQFRVFLSLPWAPSNQNFDFTKVAEEFRSLLRPGPDGFYINRSKRGAYRHKIPERFWDSI